MPVPSAISDLSQTAGSNSPAGSDSPSTLDDYQRAHASFIAKLRDGQGFTTEASVASAATCDIGAATSLYVQITGTTTITSFGANYNGPRFVRFAGALTLTHNASSMILPGGANITTAAGDAATVVPISGGWRVASYTRAANSPTAVTFTSVNAGALTASSVNGGQLAGTRNKIINGKMDVAQRGTSFAAAVDSTFFTDRFQWIQASTTVVTLSQQTDVPSSNEFQNSSRVAVTTADTSIASTDYASVRHKVEGYNARDLIGKTFTLSFWVRSSKTGTHCLSFRNSATDRAYVAEYTISAANTWEYKTITVTGGLITAGTWNWTNGIGIIIDWALAAGTAFQTTPNAWQTGNFAATSNQVNVLDTVGNIFAITGVQLEVGSVATPFEHRPYGTELALCQRYFETGYYSLVWPAYVNTTTMRHMVTYAVQKRNNASVTLTNGFTSSANAASVPSAYAQSFYVQAVSTTGGAASESTGTWVSNGEL